MTRTIIIEDEKPACQYLVSRLQQIAPDFAIVATLSSVEQSVEYLIKHGANTDLIFSDVQLTDGLSFSIFSQLAIDLPIIFITGYDTFMMNAFHSNGIDYLLKPVNDEDLLHAVEKYKMLEKHFTTGSALMSNMMQYAKPKKKSRIVVRRGVEHVFLLLDDVVLFYTENKIVFVLDKDGRKYMVDKNLGELEAELDGETFFRVNRQYILNINYVKSYKPYDRVKLQVDLHVQHPNHNIIISQETAPLFKKWIYEA